MSLNHTSYFSKAGGILFLFCLVSSIHTYAVTKNTAASGNWGTAGVWNPNGVPAGADDVTVNHDLTINQNIAPNQGNYIINSPCTDLTGGTAYTLTLSGGGANPGIFDVRANTVFEGPLTVQNNGVLYVRTGDTLWVGGGSVFQNGSSVTIEQDAALIIDGDLTNNNNSTGITIDGALIIKGNFEGGNGSEITGSGTMETDGTVTTSGSGSVFGSTDNCDPGPCEASNDGVGPLSIELLSFTAINNKHEVEVKWSTASEVNSSYFIVEKSKNGTAFEEVATVNAAANSNELLEYFVIDEHPWNGTSYYRLKQLSAFGADVYSDLAAVQVIDKNTTALEVFPNPSKTNSNIFIRGKGLQPDEKVSLTIISVLGQVIYAKSVVTDPQGDFIMATDLSPLVPTGIYTIIGTMKDDIFQKKLLIR